MSAPFRDLFVELPRAVFETLQGIGEAVVSRAPPAPLPAPSRLRLLIGSLNEGSLHRYVLRRHGWLKFSVAPSAASEELELRAVLPCRHILTRRVDEVALHRARLSRAVAVLDEVDAMASGRKCTCMQPGRAA